jgi:hypothetical protein
MVDTLVKEVEEMAADMVGEARKRTSIVAVPVTDNLTAHPTVEERVVAKKRAKDGGIKETPAVADAPNDLHNIIAGKGHDVSNDPVGFEFGK